MDIIKYISKRLSSEESPKANSDELTLQYYEMWITEGIMAAIHGNFKKITEIYVPELRLTINQAIKPVNIFICDYDRYTSKNEPMSGKRPKLLKTIIISKKSEAAKNLLWLEEVLAKKKEKEETLIKLFDSEDSS
jgi:hypothetical protein